MCINVNKMWTQYIWALCLAVTCQAQLSDIERYLLTIAEMSPSPPLQSNEKACQVDSSTNGVCVKRTQCNLDAPAVDPATTFILREGGSASNASDVENALDTQCAWLQICCPSDKVREEERQVKFEQPLGCGYSNPGANVFRESANAYGYADFGDFPWMIALLQIKNDKTKFNDQYIGGGTLIHPSVVLTVAHKVDKLESPSELTCRAGEWDAATEDELFKHQDRNVKNIVIHKNYLKAHVHYDAALLILKAPFDLVDSPHIGVACLELNLPPPGTSCYSMGWGDDFLNGNKFAVLLKKIQLKLVDGETCQNQYRNSRLGRGYKLHRSLTCAGGEAGVDTCVSDGGSPLVCPITLFQAKDKIRFSVVGMVAYGLTCGTENLPGVYVKVPEVYDWAITEMTLLGFNKSTFVY